MIWEWLQTRGGIAVWRSLDLSDPGQTWTTPKLSADGTPAPPPHPWKAEKAPSRIITDPTEVIVDVPREVRRFRVAIRLGSQGFSYKLTDASSRKLRSACEKAGENSWYTFDYDTQEAIIWAPSGQSLTIDKYMETDRRARGNV
jgi:hypothetical protein